MKCPELQTDRREVSQHVCVLNCTWGVQKPDFRTCGGDAFRRLLVAGILCGQRTCVCEAKGFCSILYSRYLWDGEQLFVVGFLPRLKRQHEGMGHR